MKSQRGLTDEFFAIPIALIMIILAAVAIPNFFQARDRAKRAECIDALGDLRRAMELYANENPKSIYPLELDKKSFSSKPVERFVSVLGKYTNVTDIFRGCSDITIEFVTPKNFTITARAKDRNATPMTTMNYTVY